MDNFKILRCIIKLIRSAIIQPIWKLFVISGSIMCLARVRCRTHHPLARTPRNVQVQLI